MFRAKPVLFCVGTVVGDFRRLLFELSWRIYGPIAFCLNHFLSALVCSLLLVSASWAQSVSNPAEETYEQGVQFLAQEKWQSAAAAFQQVLKLDAHRVDAENGLGVALGKTGDKPGSQAAFERA